MKKKDIQFLETGYNFEGFKVVCKYNFHGNLDLMEGSSEEVSIYDINHKNENIALDYLAYDYILNDFKKSESYKEFAMLVETILNKR